MSLCVCVRVIVVVQVILATIQLMIDSLKVRNCEDISFDILLQVNKRSHVGNYSAWFKLYSLTDVQCYHSF